MVINLVSVRFNKHQETSVEQENLEGLKNEGRRTVRTSQKKDGLIKDE